MAKETAFFIHGGTIAHGLARMVCR
jgi:hypothetical protein